MPEFVSYQRAYPSPDATQFTGASPNCTAIKNYCVATFGMSNLGIYNRRPIRGGTAWSTHAYGAAVDLGYKDQAHVEGTVIPWLIANAQTLGIQRIHHYRKQQYWEAGKGWVNRSPGQGDNWIHVETHPDRWHDATPIETRLGGAVTPPAPPSAPTAPKYPGKPVKQGSTGQSVKAVQTALGITPVDGKFGAQTDAAVKAWQTANGLTADGIVGPKTWAALFKN
jgi:hypothetical protein